MFEHVALMLVIYSFLERETMFVQILCGFVCSFNLVFCFPRSEGRERKGKERKEGRKEGNCWTIGAALFLVLLLSPIGFPKTLLLKHCYGCHIASLWGPCEHAYCCMEHEGQSSVSSIPQPKPKGRPKAKPADAAPPLLPG